MSSRRHAILLPLAALALLGTTTNAAPVELLTNNSFELPVTASWGAAPTNWTIGPPEPSAVNYPWLSGPTVWNLVGANPDGTQIAALNGNCRQTVGILEADKLYTLSFWVYFRSNQQFYADLTTTPWTGGLVRAINDGPTLQNLPNPLPLHEWTQVTLEVDTSNPVFSSQVGNTLYVHFWSTGTPSEILLDQVSLLQDDPPPFVPPDYYVSFSEGSDSNDGLSSSTPWKTFTNLSPLTLGPGTGVYLKRGDTWSASKLTLTGKGTSTDPVHLSAYGEGLNPVITGINDTTEACVVINNPSHWVIDSLDLRQAKVGLYLRYTGGNTDGTGDMFNNENITVSCMNFQDMNHEWSDVNGDITVVSPYELSWGAGVWIGGSIPAPPGGPWPSQSTNVLDGLTVRYCSFQNVSTGVGNGWYFPGAYKGRMTSVLLQDSWVTGCENGSFAFFSTTGAEIRRWDTWLGGTGFYSTGTTGGFLEDTDDFLIEDCQFAFNKRNGTGNDGVGMDFEGATENTVFRHNVVHDNDGGGLLILPTNGNNLNLQMLSNTFWNNARNPKDSGQNKELNASNNSHTGAFTNNGVYLGTDVSSGLAVYNNTTRWNTLFSANTGGNRTSTTYATVAARPLQWLFTSTVEGWGAENQWSGLAASGGALTGTSTGADPYVESPATWINTRERRWVQVTMSQTAGSTAQVFFQTETDPTWTPAKSATFTIVPDGSMRTYVVDMGQSSEYRGVVTKWRLDPTDASGSVMAVDTFSPQAAPYVKSLTAVSGNEFEVEFNQAMLPAGGVLNPANYALSGTGMGSLAANPSSVTQICTASGPVYRLKWDTGSASNGSAVTLTVTNAQAARGIAIGAAGNSASVTALPVELDSWVVD